MRTLVLLFLILPVFCVENSLPSDAQAALSAYETDYAKLQADFDDAVIKRAAKAKAALNKAQESATKKGKLNDAMAIKASIEKLDWSLPKPKADLLGNKLAQKTKTWANGTWEVLWAGYRVNVTFEEGGKITRQDGTTGTVAIDEAGALTLTWDTTGDGGLMWTVQPPLKSDPQKTLGKNAFGTTFKFTKQ